jgi:hypothetical protein
MEELLIETLELSGYPVYRQGSLDADATYPDDFFTFWNNDSSDRSHYDNGSISTIWDFDVNFYSISPTNTYSVLADAILMLKNNKFIISGGGSDRFSDEPTHTGRGVNVIFMERLGD